MLRRLAPLAVLLAIALTGCGDDDPATSPAESKTSAVAPSGTDASTAATPDTVIAEVTSVAPALESFYRGKPYPQTLEEAVASLADADVTLADGITIGGYVYDPDKTEFTLCLQDVDGAWASYDTAPMGVRDSGTAGGCPKG